MYIVIYGSGKEQQMFMIIVCDYMNAHSSTVLSLRYCQNRKFLKVFAVTVLLCVLSTSCCIKKITSQDKILFNYGDIASKRIAYSYPVVNLSAIRYENRYTDQNYYSVDNKRTQDAFLREFELCIKNNGLVWVKLPDSIFKYDLLYKGATVFSPDSLETEAKNVLVSAGVDFFVLVYDVRLSYSQFVGVSEDGFRELSGTGSKARHRLSFWCKIFDVALNRQVYDKYIYKEKKGAGLDLLEKANMELFRDILGK
jgi:hypothetical protein